MAKIMNGKITSTAWSREHGLTHFITVEGDGWGCSLGGYHLSGDACYKWISALMNALDIWEMNENSLIGMVVRVEFSGNGLCDGKVQAIGHPIKDRWLRPSELFAKEGSQ